MSKCRSEIEPLQTVYRNSKNKNVQNKLFKNTSLFWNKNPSTKPTSLTHDEIDIIFLI